MSNILNEYAAESVVNEMLKTARKEIKENTGVSISYDDIREPLCDYEWIFYAGVDDNGLDLFDMDKVKAKLDHIKKGIVDGLKEETTESRELFLYADNNDLLFYRMVNPITENYTRKYKRGIYDHEKAIKGLLPCMREAAKLYYKDFCNNDFKFSNIDIYSAACQMETSIFEIVTFRE